VGLFEIHDFFENNPNKIWLFVGKIVTLQPFNKN